jgi:sugar phosphate isomerase/epimerase
MALGPGDLVLCSGTLPRHVPFGERVDAAMGGGYAGISLWGRDYWAARREGLSDAEIRIVLADHGLSVAEIDPAWWWLPGAAEVSIPVEADTEEVFRYGADELLRLAEAVGARSLNAVDVFGGSWGIDDAVEAFAGLCDRAAEHGLLVHLEFLPWSRIPDLATAWEIVRRAGRANVGLAVDSWHWFRGGGDAAVLQAIPGDRIFGIQLSDGPRQPEANLIEATLHDRRIPGDGEFDLVALIEGLRSIRSPAPVGVEVFSDRLHALPALEAAKRVADATRGLLSAAGW